MPILQSINFNFRSYLTKGLLPAVVILVSALWALQFLGVQPEEALRDPAQQSGQNSLLGFISHLGTWCWVSAAAISAFHFSTSHTARKMEQYALMALLSLALAADDLFMLHERFLGQKLCYSFYALMALLLAFRHLRSMWQKDAAGLAFTAFFLVASVGIDLVQEDFPENWGRQRLILEDGFKFLGSCSWLFVVFRSGTPDQDKSSLHKA